MNSETTHTHNIVMIVDDTPGNLALLSDTLSESGYRVLVATDGVSALEQMAYLKPDIVLLDVLMPGIDGFETCKRLKADAATSHIPVIFMTALSEIDDLLRGFGEGAVDYLVKPIRPPEVLVRVETQLKQARDIQRAEQALNNGPYSALAINEQGQITWLPKSAEQWLAELQQSTNQNVSLGVESALPSPLFEWASMQLLQSTQSETSTFEISRNGIHFTAKITPCANPGEYMLLMEKHANQWNLDSIKSSLGITSREAEILMWISRGKTNKEVGLILGSSPRTINKHLEHIFEKLGVATRAAAVSVAMQRTSNLNAVTELK